MNKMNNKAARPKGNNRFMIKNFVSKSAGQTGCLPDKNWTPKVSRKPGDGFDKYQILFLRPDPAQRLQCYT